MQCRDDSSLLRLAKGLSYSPITACVKVTEVGEWAVQITWAASLFYPDNQTQADLGVCDISVMQVWPNNVLAAATRYVHVFVLTGSLENKQKRKTRERFWQGQIPFPPLCSQFIQQRRNGLNSFYLTITAVQRVFVKVMMVIYC